MLRKMFVAASMALIAAAFAGAPTPSLAQDSTCDVERFAKPPSGCQRELLTAAGRQRPFDNYFPSAKKSAKKAWERQALTKFGERFKEWENSTCQKVECVDGSIGGLRRCTYSGYACVINPQLAGTDPDDGDDDGDGKAPTLAEYEVKELQRLLIRDGLRTVKVRGSRRRVVVDGDWGPVTTTAVVLWLEENGIDDDKLTDRDVFNLLKKRVE